MPITLSLSQEEIDFLLTAVVDQRQYLKDQLSMYDKDAHANPDCGREEYIDELNAMTDLAKKLTKCSSK